MSAIDDYLDRVSATERQELERFCLIVKEVAPDAEESISYGIPTFKVKNRSLVHFGVFKDHLSLFPTSGPIEALQDKLKDFNVSKGTIQFTSDNPLPKELIKDLLHIRLTAILQGS